MAGALTIPLGTGAAAYLAFAAGNLIFAGSTVVLSVTPALTGCSPVRRTSCRG